MENPNIEASILHFVYCKSFGEGDPTISALDKWAELQRHNKVIFWEQYDFLLKKDFLRFNKDDVALKLTPKGVLHAEKSGYVPEKLVAKNRQTRKRILHTLATHLSTRSAVITIDHLVQSTKLEGEYIYGNIDLLVGLGYVRWIIPRVNLSINAKVCAKEADLAKSH